jgi:hypothetical protein
MASNGDFGKVLGPLCMDGADHSADNFVFFQSDYVRGAPYCFSAPYFSSETALAWTASTLERTLSHPSRFDIRWLGAIHALLFLGFYYALLRLLAPLHVAARIALSIAGLWIFADIGLVAYLNSFFTDTAAILGTLSAVILAVYIAGQERAGLLPVACFGASALLFTLSKAQHGWLALMPVSFLAWIAWRAANPVIFRVAGAMAIVLAGAMVWIVASTPRSYAAQARFNLIFFYLVPHSQTPGQDLIELGLDPGDVRFAGLTAYSPNTPMNDAHWRSAFENGTSYLAVLRFYIRHPGRPLAKLSADLWTEAPRRRVLYLSNFRRAYGYPAGARDPQFGSWSALRTRVFQWWPPHVVVWLALALCVPPWLARRAVSRFQRATAWAICAVVLLAAAEFLSVSLVDAIETDRHLLLFHILTDLTVFLSLLLAIGTTARRSAK